MSNKTKSKVTKLQLVAGFVLPEVRLLVKKIALSERRTESQVVRQLLEESPRVKTALRAKRG